MTDEQYYAKEWLNRMSNTIRLIESLETKRAKVLASLSGIGTYDAEFVPGNNGDNVTETKNLEYSELSSKIDYQRQRLSREDIRTLNVIGKIDNSPKGQLMKSILIDRYLSRLSWGRIIKKQHYSETRIFELHSTALIMIYPFTPKEVLDDY